MGSNEIGSMSSTVRHHSSLPLFFFGSFFAVAFAPAAALPLLAGGRFSAAACFLPWQWSPYDTADEHCTPHGPQNKAALASPAGPAAAGVLAPWLALGASSVPPRRSTWTGGAVGGWSKAHPAALHATPWRHGRSFLPFFAGRAAAVVSTATTGVAVSPSAAAAFGEGPCANLQAAPALQAPVDAKKRQSLGFAAAFTAPLPLPPLAAFLAFSFASLAACNAAAFDVFFAACACASLPALFAAEAARASAHSLK